MTSPKRRLPVLQSGPSGEEPGPERPGWQWAVLGAVAIVIAWLPLAALVNSVLAKTVLGGPPSPSQAAALVVANGAAFLLASFAGGYLVGRFGGSAGAREAAIAGVLGAAVGCAMAVGQRRPGADLGVGGWALVILVVAGIGAGGGLLGGRFGLKRR